MAENGEAKSTGPSKSFMTAGPTLHYSHSNVRRCWAVAVVVFLAACIFWSRIFTGSALNFDFSSLTDTACFSLGRFIISPISIYEYPWQIVILGLLMGLFGVVPVLVSQLLSFRYSIPMILGLVLIAKLGLFGAFVLVSCVAVACRPLRFRSRFIAIAFCMAPQLIYWAAFGGYKSVDPIRIGFSFAPWTSAWFTGIAIAGVVIAIGHFTRYRPGLVGSISAVVLIAAIITFQTKISFAELDYRLYVAENNPDEVREFHDHDMTKALDRVIKDKDTQSFLEGLFYPAEPILLREELKNEIQIQLGYDRWPNWFKVPKELNYQARRQELFNQYDLFISKRSKSKRMPIALYYKALLAEKSPDIRLFGQKEVLRFYSDYPHQEVLPIWYELYDKFSQSPESLEARWRIAMHLAGNTQFSKAIEMCEVTEVMVAKQKGDRIGTRAVTGTFSTAFSAPAETVMTPRILKDIRRKVRQLKALISSQNRNEDPGSQKRLARFVLLNPYSSDYSVRLDELLSEMNDDDPLVFEGPSINLLPVFQALYDLGILEVGLWKDPQTPDESKDKYLIQARETLTDFIKSYPQSIFTEQAQYMLDNLPVIDTEQP